MHRPALILALLLAVSILTGCAAPRGGDANGPEDDSPTGAVESPQGREPLVPLKIGSRFKYESQNSGSFSVRIDGGDRSKSWFGGQAFGVAITVLLVGYPWAEYNESVLMKALIDHDGALELMMVCPTEEAADDPDPSCADDRFAEAYHKYGGFPYLFGLSHATRKNETLLVGNELFTAGFGIGSERTGSTVIRTAFEPPAEVTFNMFPEFFGQDVIMEITDAQPVPASIQSKSGRGWRLVEWSPGDGAPLPAASPRVIALPHVCEGCKGAAPPNTYERHIATRHRFNSAFEDALSRSREFRDRWESAEYDLIQMDQEELCLQRVEAVVSGSAYCRTFQSIWDFYIAKPGPHPIDPWYIDLTYEYVKDTEFTSERQSRCCFTSEAPTRTPHLFMAYESGFPEGAQLKMEDVERDLAGRMARSGSEWNATRSIASPLGMAWDSDSGHVLAYRFLWPTVLQAPDGTSWIYAGIEVAAHNGALAHVMAERSIVEAVAGVSFA